MDKAFYERYFRDEESHWWFVGRKRIIEDVLRRHLPAHVSSALEVGCGSGVYSRLLKDRADKVTGIDMSETAIAHAKIRIPGFEAIRAEFPDVELASKFDVIALFDVLEHIVDDDGTLKKIFGLLNGDGHLCLTVPAYRFLWNSHDVIAHHKRRYVRSELEAKLARNGFEVEKSSYFNAIMFLPIAIFRLVEKVTGARKGKSDDFKFPGLLNRSLAALFGSERWLLRVVDVPFGVSLLCVAKKRVTL